VVTKAFFKEYFNIYFGTCYRITLAIGGAHLEEDGTVEAGFCFLTIWYNLQREILSREFHSGDRHA